MRAKTPLPFPSGWKPDRSTRPTRPARDSEVPWTSDGDALPSTRNRAGLSGRSTSTRRVSKSGGLALDLVDDHEAGQAGQRLLRRLQTPSVTLRARDRKGSFPPELPRRFRAPGWSCRTGAARSGRRRDGRKTPRGYGRGRRGRSMSMLHDNPRKSSFQLPIFKENCRGTATGQSEFIPSGRLICLSEIPVMILFRHAKQGGNHLEAFRRNPSGIRFSRPVPDLRSLLRRATS